LTAPLLYPLPRDKYPIFYGLPGASFGHLESCLIQYIDSLPHRRFPLLMSSSAFPPLFVRFCPPPTSLPRFHIFDMLRVRSASATAKTSLLFFFFKVDSLTSPRAREFFHCKLAIFSRPQGSHASAFQPFSGFSFGGIAFFVFSFFFSVSTPPLLSPTLREPGIGYCTARRFSFSPLGFSLKLCPPPFLFYRSPP